MLTAKLHSFVLLQDATGAIRRNFKGNEMIRTFDKLIPGADRELQQLTRTVRALACRLSAVVVLSALLPITVVHAQSAAATIDEDRIVQRLKQEIMRELRDGDFLKEEIAAGIRDYINAQRQAQQRARASKARAASENAKNVRPVSRERDHIRGNVDAKISLIEYSDFECPFCKRFHDTPKQLIADYGGRVNWVYRHFPLGFHNPGAQKQAEASECAAELGGNDAFWKFSDALYARTTSNGKGFPISKLVPLAEEIGLDAKSFAECLDSGKYAARVKEDIEEGSTIGITGTPGSIMFNSETGEAQLISGAVPLARFKVVVDRWLQ